MVKAGVQSAHADSSALANSITERLCYSGPTSRTGIRRCMGHARLRPRLARKKHTELVGARRRWLQVSASEASTRRLYELNYRQTALVDQLFDRSAVCYSLTQFHHQTYVIQTIRRDSRQEIRQPLQIICNSILNFQVQFQLAFFNDCCEVVMIPMQYPIIYTL